MICTNSEWNMLNVGRATQWALADDLGVNSKVDPATVGLAILIFREVASLSLSKGTPRGIIDTELGVAYTTDFYMQH